MREFFESVFVEVSNPIPSTVRACQEAVRQVGGTLQQFLVAHVADRARQVATVLDATIAPRNRWPYSTTTCRTHPEEALVGFMGLNELRDAALR